jgi:hypothetical protein
MAVSRPVVGTAVCGVDEAVQDGVTGWLVPPEDPEALARALVELLRDPDEAAARGRAGRRRFEATFTAARMARETAAVYDAAIRATRRRSGEIHPRGRLAGRPSDSAVTPGVASGGEVRAVGAPTTTARWAR